MQISPSQRQRREEVTPIFPSGVSWRLPGRAIGDDLLLLLAMALAQRNTIYHFAKVVRRLLHISNECTPRRHS